MKKLHLFTCLALFIGISITNAQYSTLLNFNGMVNGETPYANVVISGSTMYGMTSAGGANGVGCIFSVGTNGSGYTDLHDFTLMTGKTPHGSLILSGSTLYGMTELGGTNSDGVIFSIATNGSSYTVLHNFNGTAGKNPMGSLILSGSTLYGLATAGGANSDGCIFSITTSGGSYSDIHDFNGTAGSSPEGSLLLSGSTLYGMTLTGGANSDGVIFSTTTSGGSYTDLHDFNGTAGKSPHGSLILSGSTLYGLATTGGANSDGCIFSITTGGSSYTDLYDFTASTGAGPLGDLLLSGNVFLGLTEAGGANSDGVVFSVHTDGTEYTDLHDFDGTHGATPYGSVMLSSGVLYGMTTAGGSSSDGVIWSYAICNVTASTSVVANVSCHGGSNGSASASASGASSPPFSYSWSGGQTTCTVTGLTAGTFTVTATDYYGCSATASTTITQPTALSVSASTSANVTCHGGGNGSVSSTVSGATSPYTYSWTGGGTNSTYTGLTAGTYTLTVTDNNGCTATSLTTITQPFAIHDSIIASSIVNETHYGDYSGRAEAGVKYGTTPYTYLWSPGGETTATATDLIAGTYTVNVTDNIGCTGTAHVTITQPLGRLIQIPSDTCLNSDTMSTLERWFVVTPQTSSMSITLTNLTPTAGHIHDIVALEGVYPHLYPISQATPTTLHDDTSSIPLKITLNDLFVGIPIYISISRGHHHVGCSGCSPSNRADFDLCTENLTTPTRTVDANGVVSYSGVGQYIQNQLIVKFQDSILKLSAVNNISTVSGSLSTFIRTPDLDTIVFYLEAAGLTAGEISEIELQKVYPNVTLSDSITTSRQGKNVRNPDFWATFIMILPSGTGASITPYNEPQLCRILDLVNGVQYAEVNAVGQLNAVYPDDNYIISQFSLIAGGGYHNCDINILPAWALSTGDYTYNIGVCDEGIYQPHYDFSNNSLTNIVAGGWDYTSNSALSSPYTNVDHGTNVAGIAAGIRDNSYGIAGIAGGDEVNSQQGCALYDLRIASGVSQVFVPLSTICQAFQDGSSYLNIMNNSWTTANNSYTLRDAVANSDQHGVVCTTARGNFTTNPVVPWTISDYLFPSCLGNDQDYLTISVGASGTDGNWLNLTTGNESSSEIAAGFSSMIYDVDIIAPGTNDLVEASSYYNDGNSLSGVSGFNGTSASTPHVSGVIGLMDSYLNTPLCLEDAINPIEMFATPTTANTQNMYSGYGRLNAGWVLDNLQSPNTLTHFSSNDNSNCTISTNVTTYATGVSINLPEPLNTLSAGTYSNVDIYEYDYTFGYSLPDPIIYISSNLPGYWPRFSSTIGLSNVYPDIDVDDWCNIVSCNTSAAEVITYFYEVHATSSSDVWLPIDPTNNAAVAFTVFTGYEQGDPPNGLKEVSDPKVNADIYPNPANEYTNIDYTLTGNSNVKIIIYNSLGEAVESFTDNNDVIGFHQKHIPLNGFPPGMYLVEIIADNSVVQKKLMVLK